MGKNSRRKKERSAVERPAPAAAAPVQTIDERPPFDVRWPDVGLIAVIGGAMLTLLVAFDVAPIDRSPRAAALVTRLGAIVGALGVASYAVRKLLGNQLAPWLHLVGLGLPTLALGIAPEWFGLPMAGVGERLGPFPIAVGALVAAAGFLVPRSQRSLTVAGVGCALLLVGLLAPHAVVIDLRPALLHHLAPFDGIRSAFVIGLFALAASGLALIASGRSSRLAHLSLGSAFALYLPIWQLVRISQGVDTPTAIGAVVLLAGSTVWVVGSTATTLRAVEGPTRRILPITVEALAVVGAVTLWILLKSFTWRWSTTDENIYFYDAWLLANGAVPYRDFFFAHPPMHIAIPALLFKIFGFSLGLAKAIPVAAALGTGGFVWKLTRQYAGPIAAVASLVAFLFAHELLQASTNLNGVNLTSFWLTAGLYFALRGRALAAGITLGIAVTTGFYAIAGALAIIVVALFASDKRGLKIGAAFIAVAGGINLVCRVIAGPEFVESVYIFHGLKADKPLAGEFLKTLYHHTPLAMGLLLAPVAGGWLRFRGIKMLAGPDDPEQRGSFFSPWKIWSEPGLGAMKLTWLVAVALLYEFTMFQELYGFYFTLIIPTAAICTGFALAAIASTIVHEVSELAAGRASNLGWVAVALCVAYGSWVPLAMEANWIFSNRGPPPKREKAKGVNPEWLQAGEPRYYRWIEPAALASVSGPVVRALFWRDHRLRAVMTPGYRHFLWQKSLYLDAADALGTYVRENASPEETVAGNSLVAPAVALLSQRRIAANFVDTNAKRFKTELTSLNTFFTQVCADNIRFIVSSPSGFFNDRMLQQLPTMRTYFRPVKRFESPLNKFQRKHAWAVTLWEIQPAAAANEPRCAWIEPPPPKPRKR